MSSRGFELQESVPIIYGVRRGVAGVKRVLGILDRGPRNTNVTVSKFA